jgi:cell shape-determining protein MreD
MISQIPIIVFQFVLLFLAQVLVFSNINFSPFINPYIFPLFVLLLPFETPRIVLMILGFVSGLILDSFLGSIGMHAATGLLLGFLRPFLISVITPKGTEFEISPNIFAQGISWFVIYLGVSTFIYLTAYFIIEAGTFYNFFLLLAKIIASLIVSLVIMISLLYIFSSRKKRRFV